MKAKSTLHQFLQHVDQVRANVSALRDIFSKVSVCSLAFQNLQKLPWEKMEAFQNLMDSFDRMLIARFDNSEVWPALSKCYNVLTAEQVC